MPSLFDQTFADCDPLLGEWFDEDVVYRLAGGRSIALRASIRAHEVQADEERGVLESFHGHTWEVAAADLVLDGETFDPQPGHEIAQANGDGTRAIYEVMKIDGKRCFEPVDAANHKLLVFTKLIRRAEPA